MIEEILTHTLEHLQLVVIAVLAAIAIGVPLGIFVARRPRGQQIAVGLANILQTIPSLALFGLLLPLPFLGGIGKRSATVALVVYALLPVLRNTVVGLLGVDPAVRESAIALGMTNSQLLWRIDLPLAARTILAGIRIATVASIGTATIAAAIGAGGLGVLIFRGVASVDTNLLLAGSIPAAALALLADAALSQLERRWTSE